MRQTSNEGCDDIVETQTREHQAMSGRVKSHREIWERRGDAPNRPGDKAGHLFSINSQKSRYTELRVWLVVSRAAEKANKIRFNWIGLEGFQ